MSEPRPRVLLRQQQDFQFEIDFGEGKPRLLGDEGSPLGQGAGPTPVQLLAAAVGNCMADSLLFALRKFKQAPEPLSCEVTAEIGRNADNRLRVLKLEVALKLGVPAAQLEHLDRVLVQFESFCTVGASVAQGIPLQVTVQDSTGAQLK
ncbi:MAG: OsmC family protein [Hylemonella sp.]|uniref:OsmC family protein n=1 Tax=Hylemonella sp. TaxID=2066020 RepID=UPI00391B1044